MNFSDKVLAYLALLGGMNLIKSMIALGGEVGEEQRLAFVIMAKAIDDNASILDEALAVLNEK